VALFAIKSGFVNDNALMALLNMQGQKALILATGLTNSQTAVRIHSADSIGGPLASLSRQAPGNLGMDPAPAVPVLINALDDPDINVRRAVTNALNRIAPEAIEKARTPASPVTNTAPDKATNSVH
jgi:hypothetical protein